jgi:hypothetical protein
MGAACMTVLRMVAHRAGLIEQMVPQAVEAWVQHEAPFALPPLPSERAVHHVADQLLHIGYGMTFGALYGAVLARKPASLRKILGFGAGNWAFGSFVLLPALKIMRPEWRAKPREVAVNVAAHFLYAGALALMTDELEAQSAFQPLAYPLSLAAKTG